MSHEMVRGRLRHFQFPDLADGVSVELSDLGCDWKSSR